MPSRKKRRTQNHENGDNGVEEHTGLILEEPTWLSMQQQMEQANEAELATAIFHAKQRENPVTDEEVNSHVSDWMDKMMGHLEEEMDAAKAFCDAGVKPENNIPEMVSKRICRMLSIWQVGLVDKSEERQGEFSGPEKECMKDIHQAIHDTI